MNSRRNFLSVSASAALGGLAGALPAAAASKKCDPVPWNETVDVIIIGTGFAGLSAAVSVRRQGIKSVLVLEKMPVIGGNSAVNGGWIAIPRNPIQLTQGVTDDSPDMLVKEQMISGRGMADQACLKRVADKSLAVYDLCVSSGVEFEKDFNIQVEGHSKARAMRTKHGTGGDITTKLYDVAIKEGVDFRLQSYVEDFVMDGNEILGVKVRQGYRFPDQSTGKIVFIRARNGVVLATGGFAANKKLRQIFDPSLEPNLDCTNAAGATGEVTMTAMAHGALSVHMSFIQTGHWGSPDEGGFGWSNALLSIGLYQGVVVSSLSGKRIMDERGDRKYCSDALMKNKNADGSPAYPVCFFSSARHATDSRVTRALRDKMAWKFDNLEELATKFKIPLADLQKTVADWNDQIKAGKDLSYGRDMGTAVELKAPFVASRMWPKVHYCVGGLKTDADGRVIQSRDLQPFKRLYAIGEVTGGVHGQNRLSSTSCLEALAMGIVVAETIKTDLRA